MLIVFTAIKPVLSLSQSNKYWRCRLLLLPFSLPSASATPEANRRWAEDITSGFVRFVEFLNHIKRGSRGGILSRQPSVEDSVASSMQVIIS